MKRAAALLILGITTGVQAQQWKTLPKGVRILGYRQVMTSKVTSNFNQFRSESPLGPQFKIDSSMLNSLNYNIGGQFTDPTAYNNMVVGEYKVDATGQFNVQGTGFGYGITNNVMFYAELAYYNAQVRTKIQRTRNNNYAQTGQNSNGSGMGDTLLNENAGNLPDVTVNTIQAAVTQYYGYKPIGDWYGKGLGDMETGLMAKVIDKGTWGLMVYPGLVLPTGRVDDPNILQDVGFGDGQLDVFGEVGSGYVVNDYLNFGTTLRYTYQAPGQQKLRIPDSSDLTLSPTTGRFDVKYGDRVNWMVNSVFKMNDWVSFMPMYRFMYQLPSKYDSDYSNANNILSKNTDKQEHQVQLTTTFSSITPFLKKQFLLPAQVNVNLVQTVGGKNVPNVGRFEVELRMLF